MCGLQIYPGGCCAKGQTVSRGVGWMHVVCPPAQPSPAPSQRPGSSSHEEMPARGTERWSDPEVFVVWDRTYAPLGAYSKLAALRKRVTEGFRVPPGRQEAHMAQAVASLDAAEALFYTHHPSRITMQTWRA